MPRDQLDDIMKQLGAQLGGDVRVMEVPGPLTDFKVKIPHQVQIMELRAMFDDYGVERFQRGDLVTPKKIAGTRGAGLPHIVLETRYDNEPLFNPDDPSGSRNGRRMDIRVLTYTSDREVTAFWGESFEYEAYDPDVHDD